MDGSSQSTRVLKDEREKEEEQEEGPWFSEGFYVVVSGSLGPFVMAKESFLCYFLCIMFLLFLVMD